MTDVLSGVSRSFMDRADSAAFWEAWVGAVLTRAGLHVHHFPFVADGADSHGTTYDLDVGTDYKWGEMACRTSVEVKSVSLEFTCPGDYPYEDCLVCSQNSFLKKWPGRDYVCRDFLFVSRVTGAIVWLPEGSSVELGVDVRDTTRNEVYKAVRAKKGLLRPLGDFVEKVTGGNSG